MMELNKRLDYKNELKCTDHSSSSIQQPTSRRRGRTKKKFILFRVLLTTACLNLIIPLSDAFKLNEEVDVDINKSMTNTSHVVTISKSYSSTNFKAGPQRSGNFSSHNNNHAVKRRISLSTIHPPLRVNVDPKQSTRGVLHRHNTVNSTPKRSNKNHRQKSPKSNSSPSSSSSSVKSIVINSTRHNNVKPTMHPLRVLQTDISIMNKTQRSKHLAKVTKFDSTILNEMKIHPNNLLNHRLPNNVSMIYSVSSIVQPNNNNVRNPNKIMSNSNDSDKILERNPLLGRPMESVSMETDFGMMTTEDSSLVLSSYERNSKAEGRSAAQQIQQDESKQLKSINNYPEELDDNIAEEDHNQEVTELVNPYPDPPRHPPHQLNHHHPHPHHQSMPFQFHPHHNYHMMDGSLNNYRPDRTRQRPKLSSYYDSNYYTAATAGMDEQDSAQPTNQYELKHHQSMNKNEYYSNGEDHYNGNNGPPEHQQHQQAYLHQQPQHPIQYSHHPHSPYKGGGGDQEIASTDTMMDRFEVFYKEYKILTWASFFIVGSLALLCVLVWLYINNPPTEVVTARSKITQYLQDPRLLKFLTNLVDGEDRNTKGRSRRKKTNFSDSFSPPVKVKEL